jgi:hypothetical protein
MKNIRFRFVLISKKDKDRLIMCANLNDDANGLLQFPIDLDYWEISSIGQFTGLLDKNGKEIYENDVVKLNDATISCVHFVGGAFMCSDRSIFPPHSQVYSMIKEWESVEVIGNIHEGTNVLHNISLCDTVET